MAGKSEGVAAVVTESVMVIEAVVVAVAETESVMVVEAVAMVESIAAVVV